MRETREMTREFLKQQGSSATVHEPCRMDLHGQEQSERINEQMPFATEDFFSRRQNRAQCLARDWF